MSKTIPIVRGGIVQCIVACRGTNRWSTTRISKGDFRKVDTISGDQIRFSPYGDWFDKCNFVGTTLEARLQQVIDARKAALVKAQKAVEDAEKKLEEAKNPPVKVGDKFKFTSGQNHYVLLFDNGDVVLYQRAKGMVPYAMYKSDFKPIKVS